MSRLEIFFLCLGIIVFLSFCVYLYGLIFEVYHTRIKRYKYQNGKMQKIKKPIDNAIKIVFFSDLHLGKCLHGKQLKNKLKKILKEDADIYLFGGDLIGYQMDKYFKETELENLFRPFLNKPCFKIFGNHEFKKEKNINQELKDCFFQALPFHLLANEKQTIECKQKQITIVGLHEGQYHTPQMPQLNQDELNIVLVHQGDYFDQLEGADIVLSGHTHGGQIRIPFCPPIYSPKYGKKYNKGLFKKDNRYLIVSKGIGCNMFKYRFCAPSDIIELFIES